MRYSLTESGIKIVNSYISELNAKKKEILDSGKDTADETTIPTPEDILSDIDFIGLDEEGCYYNSWGVTDNYNADSPIYLEYGKDFI